VNVKNIEVETQEDMLILKVNKKRVLKIQINDEIKRKYLAYYLEGLDPETLNQPNITVIDALSLIEIDDFNDTKAIKSVMDELKTLDSKEKLKQKIIMLEKELNNTIFQFYQLTPEEIKYIEDSFQ
jgi:archaellum biogenesis ATPase FlaH